MEVRVREKFKNSKIDLGLQYVCWVNGLLISLYCDKIYFGKTPITCIKEDNINQLAYHKFMKNLVYSQYAPPPQYERKKLNMCFLLKHRIGQCMMRIKRLIDLYLN